MERVRRVVGLCGREFVQSEQMWCGQIHMDCGVCWIRTDYQKNTIQAECHKLCIECREFQEERQGRLMDIEQLKKLHQYIDESNNIVFFGGAGVSTESGIPDFRSKDGLYNQHDIKFDKYEPEYLLSRECLYNNQKVFYEFYRQKMDTRNIEPNITHRVLAKMELDGKLKAVVTQNIDGLHQKAGSKNVYELHGTTLRNYCVKCKKEFDEDFIFECDDDIPKCTECHRPIRPDVVLYGEKLPNKAIKDAYESISNADCLIIGGTSLTVYPAASFISDFHGKHLIIINRDDVSVLMNDETDLKIIDSLGNVFKEIEKFI